jgi:hypothetical protein
MGPYAGVDYNFTLCLLQNRLQNICIFFWRARVCRPLLRLCRPFTRGIGHPHARVDFIPQSGTLDLASGFAITRHPKTPRLFYHRSQHPECPQCPYSLAFQTSPATLSLQQQSVATASLASQAFPAGKSVATASSFYPYVHSVPSNSSVPATLSPQRPHFIPISTASPTTQQLQHSSNFRVSRASPFYSYIHNVPSNSGVPATLSPQRPGLSPFYPYVHSVPSNCRIPATLLPQRPNFILTSTASPATLVFQQLGQHSVHVVSLRPERPQQL